MGERGKKYKLKLDPKLRGKIYDRMKDTMVKNQKVAFVEAVKVEEEVRAILCEPNILYLHHYIIFGKQVLKILRKHTGQTAEDEINILINKWCERGLHPINLYKVLSLYYGMVCKVKIWDGTDTATVTPEGFLDVKTHTPDECFSGDYAGIQTGLVIITPPAGKSIEIINVYASTEDGLANVTLFFTASGNIFFKLYTKVHNAITGNIICARGDVNETISLTCPAKTFVSIAYDEL